MSKPSLSLDIGTRKVAGLLSIPDADGLRIIAAERMEHTTRSMFDGQIHDVLAVALVVDQVVQKLSAAAGMPLTEASVAAAGRALRTFTGSAARDLPGLKDLTSEDVFALEIEAIQETQALMAAALDERERPQDYHYVGHSLMGARLDGLPILNLVGQRGHHAELSVIATFLPRGVVDSLQAVLERVGLEMTGLTLEPIAALTVAVPQNMRHLNLVLVDIGAGTSDIAITRKGSVIAYDMVPIAGDEITEALSEVYLLDFPTGECVKRAIQSNPVVAFTNILGQTESVTAQALTDSLAPAVERLAQQIAARIIGLNGGPPQAVMLVGGGSLTPGLPQAIAEALGLPTNRVAVRDRGAISGVTGATEVLSGPDAITPIGIAVTARDRSTLGFHLVQVNGSSVRLFQPRRLTVADALLAAGIAVRELQGSVGKGLTVSVNGTLQMVRGSFGKPAAIMVNGQPASLDSVISHRDQITVEPAVVGAPGKATVADVAPQANQAIRLTVNGKEHSLYPLITVGSLPADRQSLLQDNDTVQIRLLQTVSDLLTHLGYAEPDGNYQIGYTLDGAARVVRRPRYQILRNGRAATPEEPIRDGDQLLVEPTQPATVGEAAGISLTRASAITVRVNGQPLEIESATLAVLRNDRPAGLADALAQNDHLRVVRVDEFPIFAQVLAKAAIASNPPSGMRRLIMLLNGQPAEFVSPIKDGDSAELRWE